MYDVESSSSQKKRHDEYIGYSYQRRKSKNSHSNFTTSENLEQDSATKNILSGHCRDPPQNVDIDSTFNKLSTDATSSSRIANNQNIVDSVHLSTKKATKREAKARTTITKPRGVMGLKPESRELFITIHPIHKHLYHPSSKVLTHRLTYDKRHDFGHITTRGSKPCLNQSTMSPYLNNQGNNHPKSAPSNNDWRYKK